MAALLLVGCDAKKLKQPVPQIAKLRTLVRKTFRKLFITLTQRQRCRHEKCFVPGLGQGGAFYSMNRKTKWCFTMEDRSALRQMACLVTAFLAFQLPAWAHSDEEFENQHLFENVEGARLHISINGPIRKKDVIKHEIISAWDKAFEESRISDKNFASRVPPPDFMNTKMLYAHIVLDTYNSNTCQSFGAIGLYLDKNFTREAVASTPIIPICSTDDSIEHDIHDAAYRLVRWYITAYITTFSGRK